METRFEGNGQNSLIYNESRRMSIFASEIVRFLLVGNIYDSYASASIRVVFVKSALKNWMMLSNEPRLTMS